MKFIDFKITIRTLVNATAFLALFTCVLSSAQAQGPLESLLEVFLVEQVATEEGIQETLIPVDEAEPGSILEYALTYTNTSDDALRGFVIKNPIPANTSYVADSASSSSSADFMVSIDFGASYESEPVIRIVKNEYGEDEEVVIPPSEYNSVRWVVDENLEPGSVMSMLYRVSID